MSTNRTTVIGTRPRFNREPTPVESERFTTEALDRLALGHAHMFRNGVYREDAFADRLLGCMVVWLAENARLDEARL